MTVAGPVAAAPTMIDRQVREAAVSTVGAAELGIMVGLRPDPERAGRTGFVRGRPSHPAA